jgi:2,3-dihydro-2,3-dihydroxybenzoate dehydrogenase
MMMTSEFAGRVALVTGAASGIGEETARALATLGARVAALDVDAQGLARVALSGAMPFRVDVTDAQQVEDAVARIEAELGPPELLVHGAGVLVRGALANLEARALQSTLAVNVEGVWNVTRAVARSMVREGRGAIVTVSSNAGNTPRMELGPYCASKAAATMLTRCFGLELASHGIRCNVVSPGSTDTPMLRDMLGGTSSERLVRGDLASFRLGIPLGRIADARDVTEVVLFLLSSRARHVTMQDLTVDGGATC